MPDQTTWESKEVADHYIKIADALVPRRQEILSVISSLATEFFKDPPRILDLGCGHGDVSNAILKAQPDCSICMCDFSDGMVKLSTQRFSANSNIRVYKQDLNEGLPDEIAEERFDAVVSCFSLHHIEFTNRVGLYLNILHSLKEGGLFVNGDRFKGESSQLAGGEFDNWIRFMVEQIRKVFDRVKNFEDLRQSQFESDAKLGDKPGTLWEMEDDLREAGFNHVDCIWKYHNLAVIAASK